MWCKGPFEQRHDVVVLSKGCYWERTDSEDTAAATSQPQGRTAICRPGFATQPRTGWRDDGGRKWEEALTHKTGRGARQTETGRAKSGTGHRLQGCWGKEE